MTRFQALLCAAVSFILLGATPTSAAGLYSAYASVPQSQYFFPIAVWRQNPTDKGVSGNYPTIAAAVAGENMNTFLGLGLTSNNVDLWPEYYGADKGELEAIKANNLYVVGGVFTPYNNNTAANSVSSMLKLAAAIGATSNLIGYNAGDEPNCSGTIQNAPNVVAGIHTYDPTRLVTYNHTAWMTAPQFQKCLSDSITALQTNSVASMDRYPLTNAWLISTAGYGGSDFISVPNDGLWLQGVAVRALRHFAAPNQPVWAYVESGGDNFGFSEQHNYFAGGVTAGSNILVNASHWSRFTSSWLGLTVSGAGLPAGTRIAKIIDATHAALSAAASATATSETITVTGGVKNSDCVAAVNLCVVNGNEYRPRPAQVNAEVWMSIINGANGIEYFCHDLVSYSFCLGDAKGGVPAATVQWNLTRVNSWIKYFAPVLNAPTAGSCSMQQQSFTNGSLWTTTSCADGILTMATSNAAIPGAAMLKHFGSIYYLFAQSDRRSTTGAAYTFTLNGLAGHTVSLVYDSNRIYDSAHAATVTSWKLNAAGQFADVLGAYGDDYQVKIYAIQ